MNEKLIHADSISKIFKDKSKPVAAINEITFEIKKGELVLVTGQSGSGKTTLLYLLSGMTHPTSGNVFVDGKDLKNFSEKEISNFRKKTIGFVFQAYNLIPSLPVLDNVISSRLFDKEKKIEKAKNLLAYLDLEERADHYPSQLSGGEKQRVAIARAILNDPKILFADEPTGNLDTETGKRIIRIFKELNEEGKTVVIASHNPSLLNYEETLKLELLDGNLIKINGRNRL